MKFGVRIAVITGAALTASVLTATSATAASTGPSGLSLARSVFASTNPHAAYNALNKTQRAAFKRAETPTSVVRLSKPGMSPSVISPNFTGTFSDSARWGAKAAAGNTLYTWWQATKVGITSGRVTSVTVYNYGYETSTPGWRTSGISTQKYNAGWEGRGLVIAKFTLGVGPWDVQHTTNCGQIRLNADANHYLINSNCDLN